MTVCENDRTTRSEQAEGRARETRTLVRNIRRAPRRKYVSEEKTRARAFRREVPTSRSAPGERTICS